MSSKWRRNAARVSLVVLLVFLTLVPILYPYLASMLGIWSKSQQIIAALDFSLASEVPVSPTVLLEYASVALRSAQKGNYTEAKAVLGMVVKLPPNVEHNLKTFITLVEELIQILDSSKAGLDELQGMIDDGAVASARQKIRQIEGLLANASRRFDLLFSALDRISEIYRIDVTRPRTGLEALLAILEGYLRRLAELKALLQEADLRVGTRLDLWVTPNPVWVDKDLTITGQLLNGTVGLRGRAVELWIRGATIERFPLVCDEQGQFESQYHISSGSRFDNVKVFTRYVPAGKDVSTLRPARSETITVPVNYYPVTLTIITSSNRFHVLEQFTAEGTLADASGRALVSGTVQLVVDGAIVSSAETGEDGAYSIVASFPSAAREGTHNLYAWFNPRQGIYDAARSEKVQISIYYLKPTISPAGGEFLVLSGQNFQLTGRLEIDSKPFPEGLVIAYLAGQELTRAVSDINGIFNMTLTVPFVATGDSTLRIVFVPKIPWVTSAESSFILRILNSIVTGLGIGVVACVGVVLSGRPLRQQSKLEPRRPPPTRQEPQAVVEKKLETKVVRPMPLVTIRASDLRKFEDPRDCIRETYWTVRRLLAEVLSEPGRVSETHREYEARVVKRLSVGASSAFSGLTRLFEFAEYSQHPLSRLEAAEAIDDGILVSQLTNVRTIP